MGFLGCNDIDNTGENTVNANSGFVSAEIIDEINASTMLAIIKANTDLNTTNPFGFESAFGYKAVKIVYKTSDIEGNIIDASGLLVIPTVMDSYETALNSLGKSFSVSMICDNHGTIFTNTEAPSNVEAKTTGPDYTLAISMTGYAGFAGIFPDYVGYGSSNASAHPYLLKDLSAQNSLDMIKASMKYMQKESVILNHQLYVSGYSQGGHLAMALAEKIEKNGFDSVVLKGVASMAGPHNVEALANIEVNASHIMKYPAFLGFLADSYAFKYDDLELTNMVVETNTTKYHNLFNGSNNNVAIHTGLGLVEDARGGFNHQTANKLFKESFINDYQNNDNSTSRKRFIENKSYNNWNPKTKIKLVHCLEDEIIPFSMSQNAFNELNATGGDVTLTPLPTNLLGQQVDTANPFIHGNCGVESYGIAVKWFADIRSGVIQ